MKKLNGYYQKIVKFSGQDLRLFSLDGVTWSSNKNELQSIVERLAQQHKAISVNLGAAK